MRSPRSITHRFWCSDAWDGTRRQYMRNNTWWWIMRIIRLFHFTRNSHFWSVHAWVVFVMSKLQKNYSNDSIPLCVAVVAVLVPTERKEENEEKSFAEADDVFFAIIYLPKKRLQQQHIPIVLARDSQNSSCMRWPPNGIFSLDFWRRRSGRSLMEKTMFCSEYKMGKMLVSNGL